MRDKLLYIPGLISILLVPIFGLGYIWYNDLDKLQHAVEFTIIHAKIEDPHYYDLVYDTLVINHHKYESDNRKYLNQLQDTIAFYLNSMTDEKSFCVYFKNETTYQNFIDVLQVFSNYDIASFEMKKNVLYVIPNKYYTDDVVDIISFNDKKKDTLNNFSKKNVHELIWPYKLIYLFYIIFVTVVMVPFIKSKRLPI